MPARCVVRLEYLKRDVEDIIGNMGQRLGERLKLKGKLKSWVSHELCRFWGLGICYCAKIEHGNY